MAMPSLNVSLPKVLKNYVEGQVASGDSGTPSEYVRELIRQDNERRLDNLEQELVAAAKGPKIELSVAEIRKKALIGALCERTRPRRRNLGLSSATRQLPMSGSKPTGTEGSPAWHSQSGGRRL
jgi:antitoxin ParD1/3/4